MSSPTGKTKKGASTDEIKKEKTYLCKFIERNVRSEVKSTLVIDFLPLSLANKSSWLIMVCIVFIRLDNTKLMRR